MLGALKHVTLIEGSARFSTAKTIEADGHTFASERFVIATGSTATVPPIEGVREARFMTHIEALRHERLRRSLVVIGAGPLGLAFALLFSSFGVEVTAMPRSSSIGRVGVACSQGEDVSERLNRIVQEKERLEPLFASDTDPHRHQNVVSGLHPRMTMAWAPRP